LAKTELPIIEEKVANAERKLKLLLIPADPNDGKNII
jgi:protein subunit release factor A